MMKSVSVVIVGAGPVGLASAIELGMRGVDCLVVERNERVGLAPRAKTTNARTRTHLRRWGIAKDLADASPFGVDYPSDVHFVTRLAGHRLAVIADALNCRPAKDSRYPEHAQWIPQYKVEEVLRKHAESLPSVKILFNTELLDVTQENEKVSSSLKNLKTGEEYLCVSEFLIGADGARSRVRETIGAKMEGTYGLSRNYNIVFRAPGLAEAHKHGAGIMYWHVNPDAPALLGPMDKNDLWFFMPTKLAEGQKISDADAIEMIKRSTGIDLPYEPLSRDEWVASEFLADKYRKGRVFLAGDACHLHPPFGGFGMNMGVADGVDLGWKIAAYLQGWGGDELLNSYVIERRPVHRYFLDEAVSNHSVLGNQLWRDGMEDDTEGGRSLREKAGALILDVKSKEFYSLGAVLGYRYENSPVIVDDGSVQPAQEVRSYVPCSRPGHLTPHSWLEDGRSLYDILGQGFSLLVRDDADESEVKKIQGDADANNVPLVVVRLNLVEVSEHYEQPMTMVRPDQHIAWRGSRYEPGLIGRVTGK